MGITSRLQAALRAVVPAVLFAAAGALQAATGAPIQLTLRDAVSLALEKSPAGQQAEAGEELARARLRQSRSGWFPHVRLTESYNRGNHPVWVFGSLLEQGVVGREHFDPSFLNDPPTRENYRTSLAIELPLFDQLQRSTSVRQARLGSEAAHQQHESMRQHLRFEAIRRYADAVLARQAVDVARLSVESAAADVDAIRQRVESGLLVESDLLAASVQLAELRQQEIRAEGDQAIADAALRLLVGVPHARQITVADDLRLPPEPLSVDAFLAHAAERRPELLASRLAAESSRLEVRKERGTYLPRLDAFASIGGSGSTLSDLHGDRLYGVTLSLDVLRPGRDGSVAAALARQRAMEAQYRSVADASHLEIITAWEDLRVAGQRLEVASHAVGQAREAMRIVRDRYEAGLITVTEQLRAQSALSRSELAVHAARNETITAHARLLRAAGRLEHVDDFADE
jgi:outer membrane protein